MAAAAPRGGAFSRGPDGIGKVFSALGKNVAPANRHELFFGDFCFRRPEGGGLCKAIIGGELAGDFGCGGCRFLAAAATELLTLALDLLMLALPRAENLNSAEGDS